MKNLFLILLLPLFSWAQAPKEYPDGHGKKRLVPSGDISFADSLVSYKPGTPPPAKDYANPKLAVGLPDYDGYSGGFVSLGVGGELVLYFRDNALVNTKGPDLYVFELGKYIEETILSISKDGKKWITVGKISGGNAEVDLGDSIGIGEVFRYVKLTDAKTMEAAPNDKYPGADIDAVAAIGSARSISISSTLLFDVNQSILKPGAKSILDKVAEELKTGGSYALRIEGHCDSTGVKAKNQKLAQDRANSVKTYILGKTKVKKISIVAKGYSDEIPVAPNSTAEGREKNRRVELFLIPVVETATPKPAK
jgi:OmpA-OmpF porin, OOP family